MPDVISPFLPVFDAEKKYNKPLRKAELFVLSYVAGITLVKKVPRLATPFKLLTGVTVVPGRGISIHPVAVVITAYAPQPIGIMPPENYQLPNTMGDPIAVGKSLKDDPSGRALRAQFQQDLFNQRIAAEKRAEQNVATMSAYEREVFADVAAGRVPRRPTVFDLTALKQNADGSLGVKLPGFQPTAGASLNDIIGGVVGELSGVLGTVPAPGRDGAGIAFNPPGAGDRGGDPETDQLNGLSEMNRLNPPDP